MSLLNDLRLDIGDDDITPVSSGSTTQLATSNATLLVRHLRLDIGDDINLVTASGSPASSSLEVDGYLQVEEAAYFCGPQYWNTREITAAGNVTINSDDHVLMINKTVPEPTTVTLTMEDNLFCGQRVILIKDARGDSATYNITIVASSGTIDGQSSVLINNPYQSYTFIRNNNRWSAI